jgi:hypothetical protein
MLLPFFCTFRHRAGLGVLAVALAVGVATVTGLALAGDSSARPSPLPPKSWPEVGPQGRTRIPEAIDRLIELYTVTNRPEEAKKWHAERAKYQASKAKAPDKQ